MGVKYFYTPESYNFISHKVWELSPTVCTTYVNPSPNRIKASMEVQVTPSTHQAHAVTDHMHQNLIYKFRSLLLGEIFPAYFPAEKVATNKKFRENVLDRRAYLTPAEVGLRPNAFGTLTKMIVEYGESEQCQSQLRAIAKEALEFAQNQLGVTSTPIPVVEL